jgi:prolyl oligopeptidase
VGAAQNKVTFAYLESLPQREAIRKRLTELWDYQRTSVPVQVAGQAWFQQNSGLQRQSPLYRQADLKSAPQLVLDPNTLSPDGSVQMAQWAPSPDGRFLAYTLAPGGSDVQDVRVRDLTRGEDLPSVVRNVKFTGLEWTKDGKGFFYSRFRGTEVSASFADAMEVHQVWYHAIDGRTPDRLVFERPDFPKDFTGASVSDDGRWLYISTGSGSLGNRLWIADLGSPTAPDLAAKPHGRRTRGGRVPHAARGDRPHAVPAHHLRRPARPDRGG